MAIGPPQYTSRHEIKPDGKGRNAVGILKAYYAKCFLSDFR